MNLFNNLTIPQIPPFFVAFIFIWSILWKGLALWKSAKQTKLVWFIFLLVLNTAGVFELIYVFVFSTIKNTKQFAKIHDSLLIISIIAIFLSALSFTFLVVLGVTISLFAISLLQVATERKEWKWLIFGIMFAPIITVIYYFLRVRDRNFKLTFGNLFNSD